MTTKWTDRYALRTQGMGSSAIREILKITQQPDIISFAGGLPAPELFPAQRIAEVTQKLLADHGPEALQYSTTEGYPPLREMIVHRLGRYGIHCTIDNVLITAGSQQALDLIGKVMLNSGDRVIVEEPTYLGALQAWNAYQVDYVTVPTDDEGMRTDALEERLKADDAKFIYALPNFQNPSGITMPRARREALVRLSDEYNVPIVEDDPYGQLRFEGENEVPLIALDAQNRPGGDDECLTTGNVIYLGTFSKTLCPGFRVAWMVAPQGVITHMVQAKQGADLHTGTLVQMVAHETAGDGFLDRHVQELRKVYRERRDLMLNLMEELFPPGVTWTYPKGGLFLWVRLPEGMDSARLLEKAVKNKVAFVPGQPFYSSGKGENTLRMNFSNAQPEQIEEGIKRLATVIKDEMEALALV
jgi:2-aminoadipate transaminase